MAVERRQQILNPWPMGQELLLAVIPEVQAEGGQVTTQGNPEPV